MQSLKKLIQYDIETVICYHGGLYKGDVNHHIAELANHDGYGLCKRDQTKDPHDIHDE